MSNLQLINFHILEMWSWPNPLKRTYFNLLFIMISFRVRAQVLLKLQKSHFLFLNFLYFEFYRIDTWLYCVLCHDSVMVIKRTKEKKTKNGFYLWTSFEVSTAPVLSCSRVFEILDCHHMMLIIFPLSQKNQQKYDDSKKNLLKRMHWSQETLSNC